MPEHTRPSLRESPPAEYGSNVARFLAEHAGVVLQAGPDGSGYSAQRKNRWGHGVGQPVTALTLDELAAKLDGDDS